MCSVGTLIKRRHAFCPLKHSGRSLTAILSPEYAFMIRCVWLVIIDFFSFNTHHSVQRPILGDYKLQTTKEHTFSDSRIIKEVVKWCHVNELIPAQLKQWH